MSVKKIGRSTEYKYKIRKTTFSVRIAHRRSLSCFCRNYHNMEAKALVSDSFAFYLLKSSYRRLSNVLLSGGYVRHCFGLLNGDTMFFVLFGRDLKHSEA